MDESYEEKVQDSETGTVIEPPVSQDVQEFSGIGPVVGVGRLGSLQRMMGIEAAQPIYDQLNASEQRHAETVRRVLRRSILR